MMAPVRGQVHVENVMELIANSLSVAEVAPTEMAREAGSNKTAHVDRARVHQTGSLSITYVTPT